MGGLFPPIPDPVVVVDSIGTAWTHSTDLAAFAQTQHGNVLQKAQELEATDPTFFKAHCSHTTYRSGRSKTEKAVWFDGFAVRALRFRYPAQRAAQERVVEELTAAEKAAWLARNLQADPDPKLDPVDALIRQVLEGGGWIQYDADRPPGRRHRLHVPAALFEDRVTAARLREYAEEMVRRVQVMPAEGAPEPKAEPTPQPEPPQPEPIPEPEPEGQAVTGTIVPFVFDAGDLKFEVRVVDQDGTPWFVRNDVCAVLGLANPREVSSRLEADERGVVTQGWRMAY
jgi:hypothetical protein